MITSKTGQLSDEANWVHGCFTVKIGTDFKTFLDVLNYAQEDEINPGGTTTNPVQDANVKSVLANVGGDTAALPKYVSLRKCRDTSLGGNDAINPLPQFGVDDDISHPLYYASLDGSVGMGQVYSENYDDTQQILYLGFGIPLFTNLASFWGTATDLDMADFVNKGTGITKEKIGYLIGSAPVRLLHLATVPFKWINAWTDTLETVKISKYYSFSSQMPMYFRFVNTILVMLATNMNMLGSDSSSDLPLTGSTTSSTSPVTQVTGNNTGTPGTTDDMSGLSTMFKQFGLDMAQIMTKRYLYENGNKDPITQRKTDDAMFTASDKASGTGTQATTDPTASTNATSNSTNTPSSTTTDTSGAPSIFWKMSWFDQFKSAYGDAIYDGHLFIGFRIEKGSAPSESFSNTTGESQISQVANSKFQDGNDATFSTMRGNFGDGVLGSILGGAVDVAKGILSGVATSLSLDPLAAVLTGAAKIEIPEVWMSSSYSRSSSFTLNCMSPYGDFESIFQSEYVPLACIMAGVLPRATGHSSHAAPFVCQAYCRGIFSSPLCIIESVEITRGADQFGFSAARLPLELSIHVSLKDLYPVMAVSMGGDKGIAQELLGADDLFNEYMLTLSGMGLRERLSPFRNIRRKATILLQTIYKNRLSPFMLGMEGGANFTISRVISSIVSSGSSLPNN